MKFAVLVSAFLLPVVSLAARGPSPLLADDGRDLSFLLKRYDGPAPILRGAVKGKRHIVPRTLQVEEVPIRRASNGLVERQQCPEAGYTPCPGNAQCCPTGAVCGPGSCCPSGNLACAGICCPDAQGDCCPNVGCCPAGQVCFTTANGSTGCCPRGQTCTAVSGCKDPVAVECPGDHFCCDFGTACTRDAVGNAICFESVCFDSTCANSTLSIPSPARTFSSTPLDTNTGHVVTNPGNSPTVVVSIVNINNNSNTVNNNAALPQVTTALVLMVVVPLLSALLLL